jgi:glutamyl-tRNA synthetase
VQQKQERVDAAVSREQLRSFQQAFMADRAYSERVLSLEPERYQKLGDVILQTGLFYSALYIPPSADDLLEAVKGDRELARTLLTEYLGWYTGAESMEEWEAQMDGLAQSRELKRGVPFMLLRVAVTGSKRTPPLYGVISVLGPEQVRERVEKALDHVARASPPADNRMP